MTRPEHPVALVTGANHGIGAATALQLAAKGMDVAICFLRTHDASQSAEYREQRGRDGADVAASVETAGRRCHRIEADLADPAVPAELIHETEAELGPVSVLVHNASGWHKDSFAPDAPDAVGRSSHRVTVESIDSQLHVDARAGALLMAEFIERHRARGADWGRVVTLTSGNGRGFPGEVSYGAGKAALIAYTLSAASEMAADGVTANVVHPPVTDTGWITDEVRRFVERSHEHHHVANPDEVANTIVWLCTDAGHLVNGNIIYLR